MDEIKIEPVSIGAATTTPSASSTPVIAVVVGSGGGDPKNASSNGSVAGPPPASSAASLKALLSSARFEEHYDGPEPIDLEVLPRPVSELNCTLARSFLVKLLRAANKGMNPSYGNPSKRPPFWPQHYWPWERLTDVHSKPRGMTEPLSYSEMMKLAIARGYQYYGYDPFAYVDRGREEEIERERQANTGPGKMPHARWQVDTNKPPVLPRPASQLNCVQARTVCAKLLRFQQGGRNPVYGSPETRPPWWPEECIRWEDMVDLRGKPPYLPDQKSFSEVLKIAIVRGLKQFGVDPETYFDPAEDTYQGQQGGNGGASNSSPGLAGPKLHHVQTAASKFMLAKAIAEEREQMDVGGEDDIGVPASSDNGDPKLPPKLPRPLFQMHCGQVRQSLCKLLWFFNGYQLPQYGNPETMPDWWPNELMDWTKLRNLRHKYDGPLGDSYTNCLRIALRRGLEYYGIDPTTYHVEQVQKKKQGGESIVVEPDQVLLMEGSSPLVTRKRKAPPALIPITDYVQTSGFPRGMLEDPSWFPPRLSDSRITVSKPSILRSLKRCKITADADEIDTYEARPAGNVRFSNSTELTSILWTDRTSSINTCDVTLVASDGKKLRAHRSVLAASCCSNAIKVMLADMCHDSEACIMIPDVDADTLEAVLRLAYLGRTRITSVEAEKKVMEAVGLLNRSLSILYGISGADFSPEKLSLTKHSEQLTQHEEEDFLVVDDEDLKERNEPSNSSKASSPERQKPASSSSNSSTPQRTSQRNRVKNRKYFDSDEDGRTGPARKQPDFNTAAKRDWKSLGEKPVDFAKWLLGHKFIERPEQVCSGCNASLVIGADGSQTGTEISYIDGEPLHTKITIP